MCQSQSSTFLESFLRTKFAINCFDVRSTVPTTKLTYVQSSSAANFAMFSTKLPNVDIFLSENQKANTHDRLAKTQRRTRENGRGKTYVARIMSAISEMNAIPDTGATYSMWAMTLQRLFLLKGTRKGESYQKSAEHVEGEKVGIGKVAPASKFVGCCGSACDIPIRIIVAFMSSRGSEHHFLPRFAGGAPEQARDTK